MHVERARHPPDDADQHLMLWCSASLRLPIKSSVWVSHGDLLMLDAAALEESPELEEAVEIAIAQGLLSPMRLPDPNEAD